MLGNETDGHTGHDTAQMGGSSMAGTVVVGNGQDEAVRLGVGIRVPQAEVIGSVVDVNGHRADGNANTGRTALGAAAKEEGGGW